MAVDLDTLPGTRLPVGRFTITDEENDRLVRALGGSSLLEGEAHSVWAYIAAQRGIGISVQDLLALAGFDIADGPMLASCQLTFATPLRVDREYRVEGEIVALERKRGRRAGAFDLLTVEERLLEGRQLVSTVRNVFVLPRKEHARW